MSSRARILYKSGNIIDVEADELTVRYHPDTSEVTRIEYSGMTPKPLMLGIKNIEAVFQLD